jgi:hypothetical protein
MHRGIARLIVFGAVGALVAGAGCLANGGDEGMLVLRNIVPMATTTGCTYNSTAAEFGLAQGSLSVTAPTGFQLVGYHVIAQLQSRITADTGQESQRTILLRGANIDIAFPGSPLFSAAELSSLASSGLTHFMAPFSGFLLPNGSLADAPFELIPADLAAAVGAKPNFTGVQALATFQVVGALGGGDVTSQKFRYPVAFVPEKYIVDNGACSALSSSFKPRTGDLCNLGQDGATDCCTDQGHLVCPAVGTGG